MDMAYYAAHFHKTSNNRPTACYTSGTTVFEECLHEGGRMIGLYWSATGQEQRENILCGIPQNKAEIYRKQMCSFRLECDGQALDHSWQWEDGYITKIEGCDQEEAIIALKHGIKPVEIRLITTIDGTGFLARRMEIRNTGSAPMAISRVCPIAGELWGNLYKPELSGGRFRFTMPFDKTVQTPYSIGFLDARDVGEEGRLVFLPVDREYILVERLERKPHGNPYFIAKNNVTGEMFITALAWSGGYRAEFKYDRIYHDLSFHIGPSAPGALRVVEPGETVVSPAVHIGCLHHSLDEVIGLWHLHLRKSLIPQRMPDRRIYTISGRMLEEEGDWILREIDIAAEMGTEAFLVDAGWFGEKHTEWFLNKGEWDEGKFLPEGGIASVRDYIHDKGMLFGIWMEAELAGKQSRVYKEHPEWQYTYSKTDTGGDERETVLDLARPGAADFFRRSVMHVVDDYKPDIFKLDYNAEIYEGGHNVVHGMIENQAWRHFESLYGVFKEVLNKHPSILLENCASGGGRNDIGMLSCFHYASISDWSVMPFSIRALNAMTLFLPPESLCYYHNHVLFAHRIADLETHLRVCLFCIPIFVGFGSQHADYHSEYFTKTREYVDLHKRFCSPVLSGPPQVFHHTPFIGLQDHVPWCVLEYAVPNGSKGYVGLFRLSNTREDDIYDLCFRGVDEEKAYRVTSHNSKRTIELTGYEMKHIGVKVRLEETNTSELYLYEEKKL